MIAVLGSEQDTNLQAILKSFQKEKLEYIVIESAKRGLGQDFSFSVNNSIATTTVNGLDYSKMTGSLLWRLPKRVNSGSETEIFESNCDRELLNYYNQKLSNIDKALIKFPNVLLAENKLTQLEVAHQVGFNLPRTVVTNALSSIEQTFGEQPFLFKPLKLAELTGRFIAPVKLSVSQLSAEMVKKCPSIYQSFIQKKFELRVICIGRKVITARIDSHDPSAHFDWRLWKDDNFNVTEFSLPKTTAEQCLKFLKLMDLNFGVFDFIVDSDDQIWFLECNPAGNYLFCERFCPRLKLLDATVEYFFPNKKFIHTLEGVGHA
ncbi:hypothetical protein [Pseudoalteromonas piscicida]|uniref:hypothetical protein n=1 Tax=Pseudoalteromonas piscicida TaxID=43662 RepID=UPI003095D5CB